MNAYFFALGISDVWNMIAAIVVFLMLPGPGTFCILTSASKNGAQAGFATVAGVLMGDAVLMFLSAIGVAAVLNANLILFKGVQYIGALYLGYLGVNLLRSKSKDANSDKSKISDNAVPQLKKVDWRRGFLVTLINPKAIIFYMAFFPLFIDPVTQHGSITFLTMAAIISSCTLIYGSLLVLVGNTAAKHLARHRLVAVFASKAAGIFLIGFGIKLTTN